MSYVKISELTETSNLNPNPGKSYFVTVDSDTGQTTKLNAKNFGTSLYANNILYVGSGGAPLTNLVAQFTGIDGSFVQMSMENQNSSGSADYVITADDGDNDDWYLDLGLNNSNFNDAAYSSMKAHDGYLYVHGPSTHTGSAANLVIGTEALGANIVFIAGGLTSSNIVGNINRNSFNFQKDTYITGNLTISSAIVFPDGSRQSIAANSTILNANIAAVNTYSYAAFTKANNALANTTGIFAGSLTITQNANVTQQLNVTGPVTMNGTLVLANSLFSATDSAVTISASPTVATPSNDGYMLHISGKNGVPSRIVTDSYGTGAYSVIAGRAARGTVGSPTALQSGDVIARFSSNGYGTTKYQTLGVGRIDFVAAENFTDANTGSQIKFWNCSIGSNTLTNIATFNGDNATFTGSLTPLKGFIWTPTVLPGAQTAITIDFANNTVIRANTSAGCTVSFTNYTAGKEVVLWLTNTSGATQTFTHGCSALNSTTGSTTYNMSGTSSLMARYYSIDGDIANTFVAIVHA